MKKLFALLAALTFCFFSADSQTLFTYGKYSADAKDFLRAWNKNNTEPVTNKAKSINDYLELYIKSRLKIREAYERRYDTLPAITTEVANLRTQISENYMADPDLSSKLLKEAFQRSQKDVHAAHIFISFRKNGVFDTASASGKANDILKRLANGEDFMQLARQYSDDTTAKRNGGDLGFITVFTLPYDFENAVYNTPTGKYSNAVPSKIGLHIFKNIEERKAVGKIKAQQILLAFPPNSDEAAKKRIADRADSLYKRIKAGDNFNKLAADFSNDYVTAVSGGLMPDIGVGQYDPVFEKALWSLTKDNEVSKPFQSSYGWHIVKRISVKIGRAHV